jgi:processive 1,2-diacylglycerol beta-glucosyltransferase
MSGGAVCGNIKAICKKIIQTTDVSTVIYVFCGRNQKLLEKIKNNFSAQKVIPIGFTDNIYEYMKAADVVLSKAGGLSSTEVAVANVPFVHLKAIPGCESYNIRYFTKNGISLLGNTASRAAKKTKALLENPSLCEYVMENQRKFIPKNSAEIIADMIMKGKS